MLVITAEMVIKKSILFVLLVCSTRIWIAVFQVIYCCQIILRYHGKLMQATNQITVCIYLITIMYFLFNYYRTMHDTVIDSTCRVGPTIKPAVCVVYCKTTWKTSFNLLTSKPRFSEDYVIEITVNCYNVSSVRLLQRFRN